MIKNVDYHITDKCNLKCVSCNHFCPLVPDTVEHKSLEKIEEDLTALSKYRDIIDKITILGGEPTIHPDFIESLKIARKLFPDNVIRVTTNATTYKRFKEWAKFLIDNDIYTLISAYPWHKDYKEHVKYIEECFNFDENYYCVCNRDDNGMQKGPLVLIRQNTDEQILNCRMRGQCCQLKDKHLYICNYAAHIDYLFDTWPFLKNYIFREGYEKVDLTNTTIKEIEGMVYDDIPAICFYCNECARGVDNNMEWVPWKKSEKKIEEWIS